MTSAQPSPTVEPAALLDDISASLPFQPTPDQQTAIEELCRFACSRREREACILRGFAGTGKTSVVGALVASYTRLGGKVVILAPTGRAAKVASAMSEHKASTIHKRIYRGGFTGDAPHFILSLNREPDTLFIIDEASMITDRGDEMRPGLLSDLLTHIYGGASGCRAVFTGDMAQLPPVGQTDSPAMEPEYLKRRYGLSVTMLMLTSTVRQAAGSGILHNASRVRRMLYAAERPEIPTLVCSPHPDFQTISSAELADYISDSYAAVGAEETLIITRSNFRASGFNRGIRSLVYYAEGPLQQAERLVIARNDYYWSRLNKLDDFIANGETAIIDWVGTVREMHGLTFADVELHFPAKSDTAIGAKLIIDSLTSETPSLQPEKMSAMLQSATAPAGNDRNAAMRIVRSDPYVNALQAKYAYCVTCHKAQGGQWKHVYIDLGGIPADRFDNDFYRWLYTAITRATEKVFLINPTLRIR